MMMLNYHQQINITNLIEGYCTIISKSNTVTTNKHVKFIFPKSEDKKRLSHAEFMKKRRQSERHEFVKVDFSKFKEDEEIDVNNIIENN